MYLQIQFSLQKTNVLSFEKKGSFSDNLIIENVHFHQELYFIPCNKKIACYFAIELFCPFFRLERCCIFVVFVQECQILMFLLNNLRFTCENNLPFIKQGF